MWWLFLGWSELVWHDGLDMDVFVLNIHSVVFALPTNPRYLHHIGAPAYQVQAAFSSRECCRRVTWWVLCVWHVARHSFCISELLFEDSKLMLKLIWEFATILPFFPSFFFLEHLWIIILSSLKPKYLFLWFTYFTLASLPFIWTSTCYVS